MSLGKQQLSDYQVCHVIGSGSFGTCYKVRHKDTNKIYVWKVIDYGEMSEQKKKLLVSEVNVLSELNSKYIVKYHDRIIVPYITTLYIIMEYCPGGDLDSLIKKCKRTEQHLEETFIWKVLYQLSVALQVCHSSCQHYQVLHRDIKPANVFLDEEDNVKLGDFGLARVLSVDETHSNTLVGTPYYMSPEVIKGGKYNLKSDIWALGCLIYELCSFKPPFHGDNIQELTQQILDKGFHRIPNHYSEDLHHIVLYMLSKNNETRPSIESLLQHPLVVKHTSVWQQCTNITKLSRDTNDQNPISFLRTCNEFMERNDDIPTKNSDQKEFMERNDDNPPKNNIKQKEFIERNDDVSPKNSKQKKIMERIDDIPPTNITRNRRHSEIVRINTSAVLNQYLHCHNRKDITTEGSNQTDPYDEIYGTCIDGSIFCENLANANSEKDVYLENRTSEEQKSFQANISNQNKAFTETMDPVHTRIHICYKSQSKTNLLRPKDHITKEGEEKRQDDQDCEHSPNSLIRQIFNSKMHMNTIRECYSSDENIYMNNKSLLHKNHVIRDKNNPSETPRHVIEETSNEIEETKLKEHKVKSYLETAIDEVFRENDEPSVVAMNSIDTQHESPFPDDSKDDQIIARCETLGDKINEILTLQSINQRIKSDHLHELEELLQEKLEKIRHHEAYIRNKEKHLQTLELNLNKRERNVALQEKMVQEKIQRAQVYLKQCKDSRKSLRAPVELELQPVKMFNIDSTTHNIDQEINPNIPTRSKTNIHAKTSKTSLPVKKSKDALEVRRVSAQDNDSSFSADPGDTSILPTMCKLDPDKVKPIKYYKHVHFNDEFIELFNDIGDFCQNRDRLKILETNSNEMGEMFQNKHRSNKPDANNNGNVLEHPGKIHALNVEIAKTTTHLKLLKRDPDTFQNNNFDSAKIKGLLKPIKGDMNHPNNLTRQLNTSYKNIEKRQSDTNHLNIPKRQSELLRMRRPQTNTQPQNNKIDQKPHNRPCSYPVKLNSQTSIAHKIKQTCLLNHQKHSLSDFKLLQEKEERRPLSNIFTNNNITKQHSRSSGLAGPGFITSTLHKTNMKDDHGKSGTNKTMLPLGNTQLGVNQQTNEQENTLTGMKKHFVKSKNTSCSNSNIQQWMNKSMRHKSIANSNLKSKPLTGRLGEDKENRTLDDRALELPGRPSDGNFPRESSLKQLNSYNLDIFRKQLQVEQSSPALQNHTKSSIKDVLNTRYADLELSSSPSGLFDIIGRI